MQATEARTSGSDPIKKKQKKKKNCSPFQRNLEVEHLGNRAESLEVQRHKENKGKQRDFTIVDDFVKSKEKKGDDLCCVSGPSLLAEKHHLPSLRYQSELEKNSLSSSVLSREIDCHRSKERKIRGKRRKIRGKRRKIDVASLHKNLATSKGAIWTTNAAEDDSALGLQVDGNIQRAVQKGELIEQITPFKEKKKRKRRNSLKSNTNEKQIEEKVLFERHRIDRNSIIIMDTNAKNHKPVKGMDTDSVMVEWKSAVVKNSTSSLKDVQNGSVVEISAGNSVDKPVLGTAERRRRRKKVGNHIDQILNDNVEDKDDTDLVQMCLEDSSKANVIARECEPSVEENVIALSVCEKGLPSFTGPSRRNLLILDLNGLLADIVSSQPDQKPDLKVGRKSLYKRPFCDDFLKFCFEIFNVGVWSSRTEDNTRIVVDFLMEGFKHELLFCWGQSKCTVTGFNTVENSHKPLFLKELRKLWDKEEPDLPWEKGDYGPANTLLLDDSPYKALRNPPFTAIFPRPYNFKDENDNTLGPGGDLRVYLEGISMADDIPHYVEQHPYGQRAITNTNPSWSFYLQVIGDNNSLLPS